MNSASWKKRFQTLLGRFAALGLDASIAASSLIAAWGLYCFLRRLAGEE
jgi:hypothetical protein